MPEAFITAHDAVRSQAGLTPGETLLVHGAAGGVGSAAVQIGLVTGARVLGVVRSERAAEAVRELGGEPIEDERLRPRRRGGNGRAGGRRRARARRRASFPGRSGGARASAGGSWSWAWERARRRRSRCSASCRSAPSCAEPCCGRARSRRRPPRCGRSSARSSRRSRTAACARSSIRSSRPTTSRTPSTGSRRSGKVGKVLIEFP